MTENALKLAVIGYPVSHSVSPRIHNYWLQKYNMHASYEAIAVESENLTAFLRGLPGAFTGINITLPHKEAALKQVDDVDETAKRIGAINTIVVKGARLLGRNTDAYGFMENLKSCRSVFTGHNVLVLGAGGAARAVCAGLLETGCTITLANRTRDKAELLAQTFSGIRVIDWKDTESAMQDAALMVNTTSLGMKGLQESDISLAALPKNAVVTDIVYNPLTTSLLAQAQKQGNKTVDGLGMLLYQAQMAFNLWFGIMPEVNSELRKLISGALA